MNPDDLRPGTIISGPKWPEPLEINKVDILDKYLRIIGATSSGKHIDQVIPINELDSIKIYCSQ